jgi:hypothetical protein
MGEGMGREEMMGYFGLRGRRGKSGKKSQKEFI